MSLDEARIHLSVVGFMAQMTVGMIPPIVVFNLLFFGPAPAWLILPILGAFAAAMTMILRGHRFGFGRESALDNLVADVRVGAEPPESRAILQDLERLGEAPELSLRLRQALRGALEPIARWSGQEIDSHPQRRHGAKHHDAGPEPFLETAPPQPAHRRSQQECEERRHDNREHQCAPDLECRNGQQDEDAHEGPGHERDVSASADNIPWD